MAVVVVACYVAVLLLPYVWPFVLALIFASLLEPVARLLRRALKKLKAARILAVNISTQKGDNKVYNLQGIQLNGRQLKSGIYVKNGHKVLVK